MRPKARGLAQHGGPPGWLEESDQTGVNSYVMDGPSVSLFNTVPVALTGASQLRADAISSCCFKAEVHNHPSWASSRKEGMAWHSSIVDRCLLSGKSSGCSEYPHPLQGTVLCRVNGSGFDLLQSDPKHRWLNSIDTFSWFSFNNHIFFSCMQFSLLKYF